MYDYQATNQAEARNGRGRQAERVVSISGSMPGTCYYICKPDVCVFFILFSSRVAAHPFAGSAAEGGLNYGSLL